MIPVKNIKPVGRQYFATVKSSWRSMTMWWGRVLMSVGFLDMLSQLMGASAVLSPYLGKYSGLTFLVLGMVNQWLRKRTTSAVK